MLLYEQKAKKLHRRYYHGQIAGYDKLRRHYDEFYLSTRFEYALFYAYDRDHSFGRVTSYCLKENADIFNMRDARDEAAIRKYLQAHRQRWLRYIEDLKDNDWSAVLNVDEERNELVSIIKDLGYDGYFNYEIDKDTIDEIHSRGIFAYNDLLAKSPAIAVFNSGILLEIESWTKDTVERNPDFVKFRDKEKRYVKNVLIRRIAKGSLHTEDLPEIAVTLSENDINFILDSIALEDIDAYSRKSEAIAKTMLKRIYR